MGWASATPISLKCLGHSRAVERKRRAVQYLGFVQDRAEIDHGADRAVAFVVLNKVVGFGALFGGFPEKFVKQLEIGGHGAHPCIVDTLCDVIPILVIEPALG